MKSIIILDEMPDNCFRCAASEWFDFGEKEHGYRCRAIHDLKVVSNVEARDHRRTDCPLLPVSPELNAIDVMKLLYIHSLNMPKKKFYEEEKDGIS